MLVLVLLLSSSVLPLAAAIVGFFLMFAPSRFHLPSIPFTSKKWQMTTLTRVRSQTRPSFPFVDVATCVDRGGLWQARKHHKRPHAGVPRCPKPGCHVRRAFRGQGRARLEVTHSPAVEPPLPSVLNRRYNRLHCAFDDVTAASLCVRASLAGCSRAETAGVASSCCRNAVWMTSGDQGFALVLVRSPLYRSSGRSEDSCQ